MSSGAGLGVPPVVHADPSPDSPLLNSNKSSPSASAVDGSQHLGYEAQFWQRGALGASREEAVSSNYSPLQSSQTELSQSLLNAHTTGSMPSKGEGTWPVGPRAAL